MTEEDDADDVYELLYDDQYGADRDGRERLQRPPLRDALRETLRAFHITRSRLSWAGAFMLAATLSACAVSFTTSRVDTARVDARMAGVVQLALDTVGDGDRTKDTLDATAQTATGEYVLEFANNGPTAVTVHNVAVDAGTMFATTAWHPVGSATVPAGQVGRVAVDLRMDCTWLSLPAVRAITGDGVEFPPTRLTIATTDGKPRDVTLTMPNITAGSTPGTDPSTVSTIRDWPCAGAASGQNTVTPGQSGLRGPQPPVTIAYSDAAKTVNADSFSLAFTATNPSKTTTYTVRPSIANNTVDNSSAIGLDMGFTSLTLNPGGAAPFTVTISMRQGSCQVTDQAAYDLDQATVDIVGSDDSNSSLSIEQLRSPPGLQLAADLAAESLATCR